MIILAASALVDELLGLPHKAWVLEQISEQEIFAPAHQGVEVLSAVCRLQRSGALTRRQVEEVMVRASRVDQQLVLLAAGHVRRAIALSDRVRVTDGPYIALAEERGCPLVTTDRRLVAARVECEVRTPGG